MQALAAAGYDPDDVLAGVAAQREVGTARDVAAVLAWRIDHTYAHLQPDPTTAVARQYSGTYTDQVAAAGPGDIGDALRQIAALADRRIDALAELAANQRPAWGETLGPVPDNVPGRHQWLDRAAVVVAYRDRYQHTSDDPIGPEPSVRDTRRWAAWQRAQTVLGVATLTGRITTAGDTELHELITVQRAAETMSPEYLGGRLRTAHLQLVTAEQDLRGAPLDLATATNTTRTAALTVDQIRPRWWQIGPARTRNAVVQQQARTAALRSSATVEELQQRVTHAETRLDDAQATVHRLEDQHRDWAGWYDHALPTRYAGLAAAAELTRRSQRLAEQTTQVAEAVKHTTARVRAVDATRPQPHAHRVPDHLGQAAAAAYQRVIDHDDAPNPADSGLGANHA